MNRICKCMAITGCIIVWMAWIGGGIALIIIGGTTDNSGSTAMLVIGIILVVIWVVVTAILMASSEVGKSNREREQKQLRIEKINRLMGYAPNEIRIIETKVVSELSTHELFKFILFRHRDNENIISGCRNIFDENLDLFESNNI